MRITLLGPVELVSQGAAVPLGGRKQRAVFALLALDAGRVVPVDRLLRELWPDDPPSQSMTALQSCVSRLRRVLSGIEVPAGDTAPRILTKPPGWVLEVPDGTVDTGEFARLVKEGRELLTADQPRAAADRLISSLSLWTGPPMADLDMAAFASADRTRLDLQRLDATELLFEAQLAAGEAAAVAESASGFTQDNPFRERGWLSLMLPLYRSGRQADALAAGARLRAALAEELGLDPSPEVASLVQRMLRHDPGLPFPSSGPGELSPPPTAAPAGTDSEPVRGEGEEFQPMV